MGYRYLLFNKPYQVLSQFTDDRGRKTLADFIASKEVYSAGRLDYDSEGLMLLTDDGGLIHQLTSPRHQVTKTYLAQVEGRPSANSLARCEQGLLLKDGPTQPCRVEQIAEPSWLWPRHPPIRQRQSIPTCWLKLDLTEGRNRQVRRMTAAIGHPTLRLIRFAIGAITIAALSNGESRIIDQQFLIDNGINMDTKKSGDRTAVPNNARRSGRHRRRNPRQQSQNRKV